MPDPSSLLLIAAYTLAVSCALGLVLLAYLGFYKVKDMDRLLYGPDHPAHHAFKAGGIFYANLRAGGDYGLHFWLILISKRFDKAYPNNISLTQVPLRKRLPYMLYVATGVIFFLACGLLSLVE